MTALEHAVRPALLRPPCLVRFSGGVDSSFVLAVAARVALREGLPAPVPVTWRFTDAPRAEESAWQERVITAVGIQDWVTLTADDDLDLVGPVARRVLRRHGVLHPVNVHLHQPLVERAAGGSLLTGGVGDQILMGWRHPGPRTPGQALRAHAPGRLVATIRQRRGEDPFPWLEPAVSRAVYAQWRREIGAEPRGIGRRIRWHESRRDLRMTCSSLDAVARDEDVRLVSPLVDPDFLAALATEMRGTRGRTRTELLRAVSDGAVPDVVTAPRPKAHFLEVFLRGPTRRFVQAWDGSGVDRALVDTAALRELWSRWPIPGGTAGLGQQLWLAADRQATTASAEAR